MHSYGPTNKICSYYVCVFIMYNYFTFVWIGFIVSGVGGGPLPGADSIAFSMNFSHTLKDTSDYNEMHACVSAFIHNYLGTPRNTCGWTSHIVTPKVPYNRRNIKYHQPL